MTAKKNPKIRRRGKNSWELQIELSPDPVTGRRRRRFITVRGTKREAEQALTAAEYDRDHGIDVAPERITVDQLFERWLRDYAAVTVAPSTLKRYRELARGVSAIIGGERAQGLRPAHVQKAHAGLIKRGLSLRSVLHHHRVMRQAFGWAVRMQLLVTNPADAVAPPRPPRHEMHTLDSEGVDRVLAHCKTDTERMLVFAAVQTGLRQGELLGLKWRDLDLDAGRASISRSFQYLSGKTEFRTPKTSRGRRSIALSPATVIALRAHKRTQNEHRLRAGGVYEDSDLVFADGLGMPIRPYTVSANFRAVAREAGAPAGFRFHDLRHTAASLALRAGVHPKIVSERLGHASVQITLDTYSHVLPDLQKEAAELMDAFVRMPPANTREA